MKKGIITFTVSFVVSYIGTISLFLLVQYLITTILHLNNNDDTQLD